MAILTRNGQPLYGGNQNKVLDYQTAEGARLDFDGVNDVVTIPNNPLLQFEINQDFSFSIRLKIDALSPAGGNNKGFFKFSGSIGYVIDFLRSSAANYYMGIFLRGTLGGAGNKIVSFIEPFTNVSGQLVHYTYVKESTNANNFRLYKDGILLAKTVNFNQTILSMVDTTAVSINSGFSQFSKNQMDSIICFNKALDASEVTYLYNTKNTRIPATAVGNVVGNWGFNQKQGTTLYDSSGNNLNGTLINFANTTPSAGNAWVDSLGNPFLV